MIIMSLDYYCNRGLMNIVDLILLEIEEEIKAKKKRYSKKKCKEVIQCLVSNANRCSLYDSKDMKITLDKNDYLGKLVYRGNELDRKISYSYFLDVLDVLEERGYLSVRKTEKMSYFEYSHYLYSVECKLEAPKSSVVRFQDKFIQLLKKKKECVRRDAHLANDNPVEVRDRKTRAPLTFKREEAKEILDFMLRYNKQLSVADVKREGQRILLQARKVFTEEWNKGGRCYMGVQDYNAVLRSQFTIEGEGVVELDYKSQHPRIIATLENTYLPEDFDPYNIPIEELCAEEVDAKEFRLLCKKALLCMFNSSSFVQSLKAIEKILRIDRNKELAERQFSSIGDYFSVGDMVKALEVNNQYAADWFYTDSGLDLQNIDSRMADYIIQSFLDIDEIVLPVHDSFIVKDGNLDLLHQCMLDAWEIVLGDNDNCIIEVKGE